MGAIDTGVVVKYDGRMGGVDVIASAGYEQEYEVESEVLGADDAAYRIECDWDDFWEDMGLQPDAMYDLTADYAEDGPESIVTVDASNAWWGEVSMPMLNDITAVLNHYADVQLERMKEWSRQAPFFARLASSI